MKTSAIIEGLAILEKYRDEPDGHNTDVEHDMLYACETDNPVGADDLARLIELGWRQQEVDSGEDEFAVAHYDPKEGWSCFV